MWVGVFVQALMMLGWMWLASDMAGDTARLIDAQAQAAMEDRRRTDEIRRTQLDFNATLIELVQDFDEDLDAQAKRLDALEGKKP